MTFAGVRHTELLFNALLSSSTAFVISPALWYVAAFWMFTACRVLARTRCVNE